MLDLPDGYPDVSGPEAEAQAPLPADVDRSRPDGLGASGDALPDEASDACQAQPDADVGKWADPEPGVPVRDGLRSVAMRLPAAHLQSAVPCKPDVDRSAAQSCEAQALAGEQAEPALKVFEPVSRLLASWAPAC